MITKFFIDSLELGFACALFSVNLIVILAHEPIANWWFRFGQRVGVKIVKHGEFEQEVERWFYKPIWGCEKCFAGQLALWLYLRFNWQQYSLFYHLLTIALAITFAVIISFIINQIKKNNADN